jgi:predicted ester cyclase
VSAEANKQLVRRLVDEAVGKRNLDVLDQIAAGEFAEIAKRWVSPFQSAFPDFEMEVVDLIAEGEKVVAHFKCSGTHRGQWLGVPATGRRFESIDEIYIFGVRDGKLVSAVGVEDNPFSPSSARHHLGGLTAHHVGSLAREAGLNSSGAPRD